MSRNTRSSTSTVTEQQQQEADILHLRGEANAIAAHSAHQQPPAPAAATQQRRADREYPAPYEGGNPDWWPEGDVPAYRPLALDHVDDAVRPFGANPAERTFVRTMLTGVLIIGWANAAWRNTFGRVTDRVFEYPIGGQY